MADDQLMLMLPSDASSTLYPENKIGDYKNRFQHPIDLAPAAYEMAVVYPSDWEKSEDNSLMFVECDWVEPELIWDGQSSLPKFIPERSGDGGCHQVTSLKSQLMWLPIHDGRDHLRDIHILIKDRKRKPVIFKGGKASLLLAVKGKAQSEVAIRGLNS